MRRELVCTETATPPRLAVRSVDLPRPGTGEVLVRVQATSMNPIDVKRAAGYGRRVLAFKGAARLPLVLGNDVAGVVESIGTGVTRSAPGQRMFGLLGTGRAGGAHASHVVVPQDLLLPAPEGADPSALAVLPYSFTTMWLALRSTGICANNARGGRVLINGAAALATMRSWRRASAREPWARRPRCTHCLRTSTGWDGWAARGPAAASATGSARSSLHVRRRPAMPGPSSSPTAMPLRRSPRAFEPESSRCRSASPCPLPAPSPRSSMCRPANPAERSSCRSAILFRTRLCTNDASASATASGSRTSALKP